ncbi:MAG TPA: alcohol dehydrogenase catalytic domain-containing protein [Candidatus Binatia bacterium]|jgi:2-desacetyl-2-hydroxyethyl bacteriochlorophyllide A dehydrogenase|nr:alcohol dehydrogenase catalytic domain-containing protein [Candidatus Binatia bacterium]
MKALVFHDPGDIRYDGVPEPTIQAPDGAVLRVTAASICGSDLHLFHGRMPVERGLIVGHEFVGVVEAVGPAVRSVRPGDRVIAPGVIGCGTCTPCRTGHVTACTTYAMQVYGITPALQGGQAEQVYVPHADVNLVPIPHGLDDEDVLFLTDILPTGHQGAERGGVAPGDVVAVIGAGPIGLTSLLSSQLMGAAHVIAVDPDPGRRDAATRFGAIAVTPDDAPARVLELTGGRGADVVIEAVGREETLTAAVTLVRVGGRVSVVGVFIEPAMPFPIGMAFMKDVTLRIGLADVPKHLPPLLALVQSGRLKPRELITHRMGLRDGTEAYRLFDQRRDGCLKIVLDPRA